MKAERPVMRFRELIRSPKMLDNSFHRFELSGANQYRREHYLSTQHRSYRWERIEELGYTICIPKRIITNPSGLNRFVSSEPAEHAPKRHSLTHRSPGYLCLARHSFRGAQPRDHRLSKSAEIGCL